MIFVICGGCGETLTTEQQVVLHQAQHWGRKAEPTTTQLDLSFNDDRQLEMELQWQN